jgi:hypothetical protein
VGLLLVRALQQGLRARNGPVLTGPM